MSNESRITLVSFSKPYQTDSLYTVLKSLGYHVDALPVEVWLEGRGDRSGEPLVLFIARPDYPREKILAALNRSAFPCLGVSDREEAPWDVKILSRCNEFARWPCHPEELALRVARICLPAGTLPLEDPSVDFAGLRLVGRAAPFVQALAQINKLARYELPVLIQGETGTGKELAARAIHCLSARKDFPFVPVNCGAIPDSLIENELFGHARGAFTDAREAQPGMVAMAEHGTLFLDEIESLSAKAQVTLLRFLQDRQYRTLGGRTLIDADVRVVAAGHEDLAARVKEGRFREDLYFRLNIASLRLPPLRERVGDIHLLAEYFCAEYRRRYGQRKTFHPESLTWMTRQQWPGNVRELENLIHREFVLCDGDTIVFQETGVAEERSCDELQNDEPIFRDGTLRDAKARMITEFEKRYLYELMEKVGGNVTQAARRAGTERRALGKLLKKHSIEAEQFRVR